MAPLAGYFPTHVEIYSVALIIIEFASDGEGKRERESKREREREREREGKSERREGGREREGMML